MTSWIKIGSALEEATIALPVLLGESTLSFTATRPHFFPLEITAC